MQVTGYAEENCLREILLVCFFYSSEQTTTLAKEIVPKFGSPPMGLDVELTVNFPCMFALLSHFPPCKMGYYSSLHSEN